MTSYEKCPQLGSKTGQVNRTDIIQNEAQLLKACEPVESDVTRNESEVI